MPLPLHRALPLLVLLAACTPAPLIIGLDDTGLRAGSDTGGSTDDTAAPVDTSTPADTGAAPDDTGTSVDPGDLDTCAQVKATFDTETRYVRSCATEAACGVQLAGTSCGCTRDWVARTKADTIQFYALLDRGTALGCDLGLDSDCDCPTYHGFTCNQGTCDYDGTPPIPPCPDDRGAGVVLGKLSTANSQLTVEVSYSGGCADHTFSLCWPNPRWESGREGLSAGLALVHDDGGDTCEAWITELRRFDLSDLGTSLRLHGETEATLRFGPLSVAFAPAP